MQKITYFCDKCGNEITEVRCECRIQSFDAESEWPTNSFDLCNDCRMKLIDWLKLELKPKPKKKPGRPKAVDIGKVQALWTAGWNSQKIADEMNVSLERINEVVNSFPLEGDDHLKEEEE